MPEGIPIVCVKHELGGGDGGLRQRSRTNWMGIEHTVEPFVFFLKEAFASKPPVADIFSVLMISFDRSRSALRRSNISAFLARSSSLNLFRCTRCWRNYRRNHIIKNFISHVGAHELLPSFHVLLAAVFLLPVQPLWTLAPKYAI